MRYLSPDVIECETDNAISANFSFYDTTVYNHHFEGLVPNCSISSALAMEILQSSTEPTIFYCLMNNLPNISCRAWLPANLMPSSTRVSTPPGPRLFASWLTTAGLVLAFRRLRYRRCGRWPDANTLGRPSALFRPQDNCSSWHSVPN